MSDADPGGGHDAGKEAAVDLSPPSTLPRTRLSNALDAVIEQIGNLASWLWLVLVGIIMVNVTMRYLFGEGRIEFEELQWHLYAVGFLIGLSYCMASDSHVRVDVLHNRFSLKTKAWIELLGLVFFLAPFIALVLIYGAPFVQRSFEIGEVSDAPGGLPYRWAIKAFLLIGFGLLAVAAVSRLARVTAALFGVPRPLPREPERSAAGE